MLIRGEGIGEIKGFEKPHSGSDGPWNEEGVETGRKFKETGDGKPSSGFDGPWNEEGVETGNKFKETEDGKPSSGFDGPWNESNNREIHNDFIRNSDGYGQGQNTDVKENAKAQSKEITDVDKNKMQEESGWSYKIIDDIHSSEEYDVYKNADVVEENINGKSCLVKNNIDLEQKDEFGRTNRERMANGLCPLSKDGQYIELHHIGQKSDGALVELTTQEHRCGGNDTILHDKTKESEINRSEFASEKNAHWKSRADIDMNNVDGGE